MLLTNLCYFDKRDESESFNLVVTSKILTIEIKRWVSKKCNEQSMTV